MNFTKQEYRRIAACLWLAANKYLWDGFSEFEDFAWEFSCAATDESDRVLASLDPWDLEDFLESLGVDVGGETEFDEFEFGEVRQGARFLWLDFAALYAEELGK